MTEQTTTIPTPARDAYAALREQFNAEFAAFSAERTPVLNATLTKDAAVDLAVQKYIDAPRSSVSKKEAIEEIVNGEFNETEIASQTYKAERLANSEGSILRKIASGANTVWLQKEMAKVATEAGIQFRTERLLETAFRLQRELLTDNLWDRVAKQIGGGMAPLDALDRVREQVTSEALSPWNDPTSRSTSLSSNLTKDQQQFVATNWLKDTEYLARRD